MNRILLLILLCVVSIGLFAQDLVPWSNIRHSSYTSQNTMNFRCESVAALASNLIFIHKNGDSWVETPMTNLMDITYNVFVPYTVGQDFHYLMKAQRDSIVWLTPAKITSTAFPPALNSLSFIGTDPTGDSNVANDNNLDITGTYFGYSDTKFYTVVENVSGAFPSIAGLAGFDLYVCGLLNPEAAIADSTLFAMVYVNIPFLYSPGIYKIKLSVTDFQFSRIGDAQSTVNNGKLYMSCNISDLTADAAFGPWPNTTNILVFDAATIQAGISGTSLLPSLADWGPFTTLSFVDYVIPAYTNHLPLLSELSQTNVGNQRIINLLYSDEDSDFPLTAEVVLDNTQVYPMTNLVQDFSTLVQFSCTVPTTGWTNGTIRFSDNNDEYVTINISSTENEDVTAPTPLQLQIYPNPFNVRTNSNVDFRFENKQNEVKDMTIYNLKGQVVKHIQIQGNKTGVDHISWNGKDETGSQVSAGVYLSRLNTANGKVTRKFLVLP